MLTKKEIIKQLKNEKIFMGRDPNRTFDYYEENGLLPEPVGYRQHAPLYPDHTPWVIKEILFSQQVGKRTLNDIKREFKLGISDDQQLYLRLGLEDPPLNIFHKLNHHGQYASPDSDILVVVYKTRLIFLLVEGFRTGLHAMPEGSEDPLQILNRKILSLDEYGAFVRDQAIKRLTGEGKLLEEDYLFEILFG